MSEWQMVTKKSMRRRTTSKRRPMEISHTHTDTGDTSDDTSDTPLSHHVSRLLDTHTTRKAALERSMWWQTAREEILAAFTDAWPVRVAALGLGSPRKFCNALDSLQTLAP